MIEICEKGKCTGCMECVDTCPKKAIKIVDSGIEYSAVIDSNSCIECNLCHNVCQNNRKLELTRPIYWKQGWASDENIRTGSSSGGLATAVACAFVKNGGIVCSCIFHAGEFVFDFAETEDEVSKFSGSKYVKSNPKGIYPKIVKLLNEDKKVLFIGLPCQVSAVKHYARNHQNLYTIDLICHGTPSPRILERFFKDYGLELAEIDSVQFRVKNDFALEKNSRRLTIPSTTDYYLMTFLNSTSYTENCYTCNYAQLGRAGDITLGDSWGSELDSHIQEKGISLLLCQNEKGIELVNATDLVLIDVDLEHAVENNHQLQHPSFKPQQREVFFREFNKGRKFRNIVKKSYPKEYIKNIIKIILYRLKIRGGY